MRTTRVRAHRRRGGVQVRAHARTLNRVEHGAPRFRIKSHGAHDHWKITQHDAHHARIVVPVEGYEKEQGMGDRIFDLEAQPPISWAGKPPKHSLPYVRVVGPEPRGRFQYFMGLIYTDGRVKVWMPAVGARARTYGGTSLKEHARIYLEDIAHRIEWE